MRIAIAERSQGEIDKSSDTETEAEGRINLRLKPEAKTQ